MDRNNPTVEKSQFSLSQVITLALLPIGMGVAGYVAGRRSCKKEFKPIMNDLETRVKKLQKGASVKQNASLTQYRDAYNK